MVVMVKRRKARERVERWSGNHRLKYGHGTGWNDVSGRSSGNERRETDRRMPASRWLCRNCNWNRMGHHWDLNCNAWKHLERAHMCSQFYKDKKVTLISTWVCNLICTVKYGLTRVYSSITMK
jgi:hypothetical protein